MQKYKPGRWKRLVIKSMPKWLFKRFYSLFIDKKIFEDTKDSQTPNTLDLWYNQFIVGHCTNAYWPVHFTSTVVNPENIYCGIETSPGISPGNYIQALGKITIGDYTQIAPNVGIISANHELTDNRKHIYKHVIIGKYCWLGMGAIILPGVELGDYTIVAAGAVVSKSFSDGYCVIGGNPAKKIKDLDKESCIFHKSKNEYNGYIRSDHFQEFRKKYLNI